ncbi:MAG: hypothetical protein IJJ99_03520 [Oscillospiraceae bacterium]|nr:hypothetical protein [Oscillospiraceae bacterium]
MKNASRWLVLALTFCAAAAGFLIRRQQLATELMSDGSLAEGSTLHVLLTVLAGILFVGLIAFLYPLPKKESWQQVFPAAIVPNLLLLLSAAGLIVGNVILWRSGSANVVVTQSPEVSKAFAALLPPLGVVSAICFAGFAVLRIMGKKPSPLLFMIASLYLIVRLIVCFQVWNTDPSIHDYAFQLLAAICCMLGCFQLAGFSFDRGHLRMCLFWTLSATAFCAFTAADTLHAGVLSNTVINASLLLAMATCSACLLLTDAPLPEPETGEAQKEAAVTEEAEETVAEEAE